MAFLAVGWLAVWAPLLHPLFHDHGARAIAFDATESFGSVAADGDADCPFCAILFASPGDVSLPPSRDFGIVPTGRQVAQEGRLLPLVHPIFSEARAPPAVSDPLSSV
jgi:hypothetical protein